MNFLEQVEHLIKINSVSRLGNEEACVFLSNLMARQGFQTKLQEVSHSVDGISKRQFNVLGVIGDPLVDTKTKKGLLLSTHIDTAPPGEVANWTETFQDPFRATFKEDRVYGLGTSDAKIDLLCKIKACERYRDRKLRMPVYLVGTAGGEIGSLGAKYLTKSAQVNPKYILVGAPTELSIVSEHKGRLVYRISVSHAQIEKDAKGFDTRIALQCAGVAAGASNPSAGENAILRLVEVMNSLRRANFQLKVTRIKGGDSSSKVPSTAAVEFYIQSSSFEDFKKFYRENLQTQRVAAEFGGLGEVGLRFLPDTSIDLIATLNEIVSKAIGLSSTQNSTGFYPASFTSNFGTISSRIGALDLEFDIRILPETDINRIAEDLKAELYRLNQKLPSFMIKVERLVFSPPFSVSTESDLVRAAKDSQQLSGIAESEKKLSLNSDASVFSACGYESIVFGPGIESGSSHCANEYNLVDHLDKAVRFYDRMIERFCI